MSNIRFTQGNLSIGALLPNGNLYTTKPFTFIDLIGEYNFYIKPVNQDVVNSLANCCTQTVDLNDPIQVEAYQNQ